MDAASEPQQVEQDVAATEAFAQWINETLHDSESSFERARTMARRMGAQRAGDRCELLFWAPELLERRVPAGDVFVEVLDADESLELLRSRQTVRFRRTRLPVARVDAWCATVATGMVAGTRGQLGSFYSLVWRDSEGQWERILDPLAASLPFGVFAPAEYYDVAAMQATRTDQAYYAALPEAEVYNFPPCANILQVHVPTATASRTIAGLTRHIETLADRLKSGSEPTPAERITLGYEAIQLLPVAPTITYESGPEFWSELEGDDAALEVDLRRPDTTNWGYDIVLAGMGTVNPALLESGRPDELVDLAAALHNIPGRPKKLIVDVVFGHADNQGLRVLNRHYFAGPNMYGQNVNFRNPVVRAVLLEMQRRAVDFGADGVRVDGAQDFQWWDSDAQTMRHDDEYLQEMSDLVQEVAGRKFRPWFIFEDGRPWPVEDWELSSTYRAVIENQNDPDVFQWGPLTFAHNTPFLYTFWLTKYWRIEEILRVGENWISGCANHDTLRRGTQISPKLNVNTRLGETRMEILDKAYDNAAASMLTYACFPGVPMDFLNAMARASWGFIRNQDDRWGVKVVAEEVISFEWQVDAYAYQGHGNFQRLKEMGFATRESLARLFSILPGLVDGTQYDLGVMSTLLNAVDPPLDGPSPYSPEALKHIARAWMDDMHDYCNVSHYVDVLGDAHTRYMLNLRRFRTARPWLRRNLSGQDYFDYRRPTDGSVVFRCLRNGPDGEQVYSVAHLEGKPLSDFDPTAADIPGLSGEGWTLALASPQIGPDYQGGPIELQDGMALLFTRKTN